MAKGDPSSVYIRETIAGDAQLPEVISWVSRELGRIMNALDFLPLRTIEYLNSPPAKPREGMLTGADGTNWNPGAGRGVYGFYAGAWHFLFSDTGVGIITTTNLADLSVTTPKLDNLSVTNAKVNDLNAVKITAGDIAAARMITNFLTAAQATIAQLSAIVADLGHITAGDITLNASGFIKGGQSGYNTGIGFFLGNSGGIFKFSIGDPAGNRLTWDGSVLTLRGVLDGGDITNGTIPAIKLTSGISAIEIFATLPVTGNFEGRVVYLTTDDKLYRYDGSTYIKTTDGADLVANSVTAAKMNVAQLSAITADIGDITAGSIRGVNVNASSHTTVGSYLASAPSGGATTVNVKNTADFPTSGTAHVIDTTNDRDDFTYTGKTATTLTGCSGVLAHNSGATIIPKGVKCMVIDGPTNEMRFYGDRGDGTIEELVSIGIVPGGADTFILAVGSSLSVGRVPFNVNAGDTTAIKASSQAAQPTVKATNGSASTAGHAFRGTATAGNGGVFDNNVSRGNVLLPSGGAFPSDATAGQITNKSGRFYYSDGSAWLPPNQPYFESSEQSIPSGNTLVSVSHGLTNGAGSNRTPKNFRAVLRCKTTEFGFAVGDELDISTVSDSGGGRPDVFANATSCKYIAGTSTLIVDAAADGSGPQTLTSGNWRIVFYAS